MKFKFFFQFNFRNNLTDIFMLAFNKISTEAETNWTILIELKNDYNILLLIVRDLGIYPARSNA